jgi:hypothetical protein
MSSAVRICGGYDREPRGAVHRAHTHDPNRIAIPDFLRLAARRLIEIPLLYRELEHNLALRSRNLPFLCPTRSRQRSGATLNEALMDARTMIEDVVGSWSKLVSDERQIPLPGLTRKNSVETLCAFLLGNLQWLLEHPAGADFIEEIERALSTATAELGAGGSIDLGRCLAQDCGDPLQAILCSDKSRPRIELRCDRGHCWQPDRWLSLKSGSQQGLPGDEASTSAPPVPRLISTRAAALALGVPEATIRQWAHRGKLTRYGTAGRPEYDLYELIGLSSRAPHGVG